MSREFKGSEYNKFVKGFITEASPLTFPVGGSLDEENFQLNHDGSRSRRLGLDIDQGASYLISGNNPTLATYRWQGAGGSSSTNIICVQAGNRIDFFFESSDNLS